MKNSRIRWRGYIGRSEEILVSIKRWRQNTQKADPDNIWPTESRMIRVKKLEELSIYRPCRYILHL